MGILIVLTMLCSSPSDHVPVKFLQDLDLLVSNEDMGTNLGNGLYCLPRAPVMQLKRQKPSK